MIGIAQGYIFEYILAEAYSEPPVSLLTLPGWQKPNVLRTGIAEV